MGFLDGYRVLDLTDERGLLAGRILADLGADVVQVEPVGGSTARSRAPHAPDGGSYFWDAYAANKRGIALDLGSVEGRRTLRDLAAAADVLIDSGEPPGLDELLAGNERLVHVSISAFGRTGPKAGYAASDLVVWAAGGPLDPHRDGDRPPVRISVPQAFLHAGADAAGGALLALLARARTGRGQRVDVSAQASLGIATLGTVLADAVGHERRPTSGAHEIPTRAIDQSGSGTHTDAGLKKWPCRDGLVEFHIGIGPAVGAFTAAFFRWMVDEGVPVRRLAELDWRTVPKLIRAGEFTEDDGTFVRTAVAEFLAGRTKAEVLAAARDRKLLCVPINDTDDLRTGEQLAARDYFGLVGEGARQRLLPLQFARVDGDGPTVRRPAPLLGEHTDEVITGWTAAAPAASPATASSTAPPLAGLKVLDLSWVVAGPVIGRALADFGATVVRVESSTRVETARFMPPFHGGVAHPENSALYGTCNAGKLGVTLDLGSAAGRAVARDLADWADVVVESFSPGLLARWGLDHPTLSADRDDLVMLSTSINGQTGPMAALAGFGNVGAALSGFQAVVGWPDRPPLGPYGPYTDYVGPRFSLAVLLAALDERRRTGRGCYIDVSQVEAGVFFQSAEIADNAATGRVAERIGNADREFAPHGVYPAPADEPGGADRFVAVAVTTDEQWRALATAIGRPDLRDDPDLAGAPGRRARAAELDAALTDWTLGRPAADAERELQAVGVPAHVSASSRDFCTDPQLRHRGHLVELAHPLHGTTTVEGPRYLLSETPGRVARAAPTFGQHNRHVLVDLLGYPVERFEELTAAGVLR
jgi:crotonobetainyl-CoA:carnitine CoA-transferase CaiB-like acyl-CoA transferase